MENDTLDREGLINEQNEDLGEVAAKRALRKAGVVAAGLSLAAAGKGTISAVTKLAKAEMLRTDGLFGAIRHHKEIKNLAKGAFEVVKVFSKFGK